MLCSVIARNFNTSYRDDERERLSQLPVVDLGEDFDFEKVFEKENISTNENKNNLNEIREKKQISLEAWSKGHVPGLRVRSLHDFNR